MNRLFVSFNNISPDTIERHAVDTQDIQTLNIPHDAVCFYFEDEQGDFIPPLYYLGDYAGGVDDFPLNGLDKNLLRGFVRVYWGDFHGKNSINDEVLPLYDDTVLMDRRTRKITWPSYISENQPK